jgi:hypothetical protein
MSLPEFVTSDLQIAAYLGVLGHDPVRLEGPLHRRCFVFQNVPTEAVSEYHRGTRPVAPVELFSTYRRMKRLLFR